ncbi:MAG: tRNA 2-selenouridine(34) synthase MnmH [Gammaproteobacteria bacterium]|jgi:tRNA 2-selenouridine synthase
MSELPTTNDYRRLFLEDVPMLDVRAPVEFSRGAFPRSENVAIINDDERHRIGIRYKEMGQDAAVELGAELVTEELRSERIDRWARFFEQHPGGVLYCFRGGMRSKLTQQWLRERTGMEYPRVEGGYKALRRFLIDELEAAAAEVNTLVIGGRTGAGKTLLLNRLPNTIDLEGLARHRGSAFGHYAIPQPTQIDFENALSIALLKHRARGNPPLIIEDEGQNIGSVHLPLPLFERFKAGDFVILEADIEERTEITWQEYVVDALADFAAVHGPENAFHSWHDYVMRGFGRIRRRLGGVRHKKLGEEITAAMQQHRETGEMQQHKAWIRDLLVDYYDPMYDYQIGKKSKKIVFSGNAAAVQEYLMSRLQDAGTPGQR